MLLLHVKMFSAFFYWHLIQCLFASVDWLNWFFFFVYELKRNWQIFVCWFPKGRKWMALKHDFGFDDWEALLQENKSGKIRWKWVLRIKVGKCWFVCIVRSIECFKILFSLQMSDGIHLLLFPTIVMWVFFSLYIIVSAQFDLFVFLVFFSFAFATMKYFLFLFANHGLYGAIKISLK